MDRLKFKRFLEERNLFEAQNKHLEHLEDIFWDGGINALRGAIGYIQNARDSLQGHASGHFNVNVKFDGAPAIICGINPENGRFFVATKGVFAKTPKLNYTNEDIDRNHPGEGLSKKLKIALAYLPELGIKGILQGDMMYTQDDLKSQTIDGKSYVTFRPNTITYAVPSNSTLASRILSSKMGIVFHTSYSGKTISSLSASFSVNIGSLNPSRDVWFRDSTVTDASGTATFTANETKQITELLSQIGSLFRNVNSAFLNQIAATETYSILVKTYINSLIRSGSGASPNIGGLLEFIKTKYQTMIDGVKTPASKETKGKERDNVVSFFIRNMEQMRNLFHIQQLLVEAKQMVIYKLNQIQDLGNFLETPDGFKVTNPEGFVAVDHVGNAVKLVSRLDFSHANFTLQKNWST